MPDHRMALTVRLAALAVSTIAAAGIPSRAWAGLIPGGGAERSDCYVELSVLAVDSPGPQVTDGRVVTCTDGDPCDGDLECGDDSCDLHVAVCIGQSDPNLLTCTPAELRSLTGRARRLGVPGRDFAPDYVPRSSLFQSTFPVDLQSGPSCGRQGGMSVAVRVTKDGRKLPGRLELSLAATAKGGASPARDRDRIVLECRPRTSECPRPDGAVPRSNPGERH